MNKKVIKENGLTLAILVLLLAGIVVGSIASVFVANYVPSSVISHFDMADTLPDGNGQKATVILLNGQSNASGVGAVSYLKEKSDTTTFAEYEGGYEKVLINFFSENGNHSSNGEFVKTTLGQGCTPSYIGPELGLADQINETYPNELFIILKYSWGGSSLHNQWRAPRSEDKTGELYTAFISFTSSAMNYLLAKNYDAEIKAMCWMQGESDAFAPYSQLYKQNLIDFVADVRSDLKSYSSETFHFIDAGISDSPVWTDYQIINQAKSEVATITNNNHYIDTIAAGLGYDQEPLENPDLAHYDALSTLQLGHLFANEIISADI